MGKDEQVILLGAMLGPGMTVRPAILSVLEGKLSACQLFPRCSSLGPTRRGSDLLILKVPR